MLSKMKPRDNDILLNLTSFNVWNMGTRESTHGLNNISVNPCTDENDKD